MKRYMIVILFCFSASSMVLIYQNCGGQQPSNSLCFGGSCTPQPSGGCPANSGTYFIAAANNCQACQYGYNASTQSCSSYSPPGSAPTYSCAVYPVGSQTADASRNCLTGCTVNPGETYKCQVKSFVLAPNDFLYGCGSNTPQCANLLEAAWVKSSSVEGQYTYSVYSYTYLNNHMGANDSPVNTIIRDSQGRLSPVMNILVKTGATSGGAQTYTMTCNAGNNQSISTSQTITLPSGASASDMRFTSVTVNTWSNNGFNNGGTYTNPPIFQASFSSNTIVFQCNQAAATVTFMVAAGQGGNATWQITNRSQLP